MHHHKIAHYEREGAKWEGKVRAQNAGLATAERIQHEASGRPWVRFGISREDQAWKHGMSATVVHKGMSREIEERCAQSTANSTQSSLYSIERFCTRIKIFMSTSLNRDRPRIVSCSVVAGPVVYNAKLRTTAGGQIEFVFVSRFDLLVRCFRLDRSLAYRTLLITIRI